MSNISNYKAGVIRSMGNMSATALHDNLMGGLSTSNGCWSGEQGNSCWLPDTNYIPNNKHYNNMWGKSWSQILKENSCTGGIFLSLIHI